ncbi:hypothetical protein RF11_12296 [Thelohanellus kitauei]|uniref:Uncharacterized protein n=1 Tax=Thelohanellus kitauei TaxID=669202 RepID=A0A0C2JU68_THEKT|nr:hypothetical protein RF11_12296 [Thelohanellus kitauei]
MSRQISSTSLVKILVLVSALSIIYQCTCAPVGTCHPEGLQKLEDAIEEVKTRRLRMWEIELSILLNKVTLEKGIYLLVGNDLIRATSSKNKNLNKFVWNQGAIAAFCKSFKRLLSIVYDLGDFHCENVVRDITACLHHHQAELRAKSFVPGREVKSLFSLFKSFI